MNTPKENPAKAVPPHLPIREWWLARRIERALDPDRDIVDAHHHLWDRPNTSGRYLLPDLQMDIANSGHRVSQTVYVQARSMYRSEGPEVFKPVGEVEFARSVAEKTEAEQVQCCAAIVGCADLTLGDEVDDVLEKLIEAGRGKLRGIRFPVAFHADPRVRATPNLAPAGLLLDDDFQAAARRVARAGLSLDVWVYHTQLAEISILAETVPELTIIINHAGGPLGIGPYEGNRRLAEVECLEGLARLATSPNVSLKLGGLAMHIGGLRFHEADEPPSSEALATAWRRMFDGCLELFGPGRCMLESNFPVDKGMAGYGQIWNAFKRMASELTNSEKNLLFSGTARARYNLKVPGE